MGSDGLGTVGNVEKSFLEMQSCVEEAERQASELEAFLALGAEQAQRCLQELADCEYKLAAWTAQSV